MLVSVNFLAIIKLPGQGMFRKELGFIAKTMLGPPTQILGDGGNDRGFSWNKLHRTIMGRGGNWKNSAVVTSTSGAAVSTLATVSFIHGKI
ncbi:hypothetical protein H5410_016278 [Solanum commersonii]|uniref:Uncharacterized protein n=1 Tax=Solanum commersonii TaxID=4109 RepID=A0A9J5ZVY8_SOLCO|nr:hypothetical protein H5410_016278 [Solanum commersonii]